MGSFLVSLGSLLSGLDLSRPPLRTFSLPDVASEIESVLRSLGRRACGLGENSGWWFALGRDEFAWKLVRGTGTLGTADWFGSREDAVLEVWRWVLLKTGAATLAELELGLEAAGL